MGFLDALEEGVVVGVEQRVSGGDGGVGRLFVRVVLEHLFPVYDKCVK